MGSPTASPRLHLRSLAALAAVCVTALATAPPAMAAKACESANAAPSKSNERTVVRATLCTINAHRERHGLRPLTLNKRLAKAARGHAGDMDQRNYFSHDSLGGGSFVDRIRLAGYLTGASSWSVGENLAWATRGNAAPGKITKMWMDSAGHRANILSSSFREIGIGVAYGAPVAGGPRPAATYATDFGLKS
jgi:uncharacterized protein YkwD